jgi:hypothetical protein
LIWQKKQDKWQKCAFAKTTANYSNSFCRFHFISSASRRQRPLIVFIKIRLLAVKWHLYGIIAIKNDQIWSDLNFRVYRVVGWNRSYSLMNKILI